MTWMRLDDGFDTHPKVLSLVNKADPLNVWVRLLAWAGRQRERDGRVPRVVGLAYGTPKALARLVEVGLYDVTPDGWAIHDFEEYAAKGQVSGDPSDLSRKRAEAGRKGGIARVSRIHGDQPPEATGQATEQATAKQTDFASSNLLQANEAIASVRAGAPAPARAPVPIPSRPDPDVYDVAPASTADRVPLAELVPLEAPSTAKPLLETWKLLEARGFARDVVTSCQNRWQGPRDRLPVAMAYVLAHTPPDARAGLVVQGFRNLDPELVDDWDRAGRPAPSRAPPDQPAPHRLAGFDLALEDS